MNNNVHLLKEDDLVEAGFERLDQRLLDDRAPKIKWGHIYEKWPADRKLTYLEKLATSMNHAASLIQDERNQLVTLVELKEQQIEQAQKDVNANNAMLQAQITKHNAEKQDLLKASMALQAEIKTLKAEVSTHEKASKWRYDAWQKAQDRVDELENGNPG